MQQVWDPGNGTCDFSHVAQSLTCVQYSLSSQDKEVFGSIKKQIEAIEGGVGSRAWTYILSGDDCQETIADESALRNNSKRGGNGKAAIKGTMATRRWLKY